MAQTEREALVAVYNATGGPSWNENWNTDAELSQWHGITTNDQGRVVQIRVFSNNLQGSIQTKLGALSELQELYLNNNRLTGSIPKELGALSELRGLYLSHNQLTGPIPEELGALSKLKDLWVTDNQLTGPIPPELGNLAALQYLDLKGNQLRGPIPRELGNLAALRYLKLLSNQLSGPIPPELGNLRELKSLELYNNQLTGHLPRQLGDLSALEILDLSWNRLDGPIPKELGALSELRQLYLSNNKLTVFPGVVVEKFAALNVTVRTDQNPWTEPPADVLQMGMAYTAGFLKDLHDYGRISTNRLKVVLVGLGNAGKTSVAVRLEGHASSKSLPNAEERTVGVEIRDIKLRPGPAENGRGGSAALDVKLWDFAGQRAYYDTHQMFLTPDALFVLVVDMFAYSEDGHSREDSLEQWLDILQSRVPGSVVLVVGTHGDRFNSQAECSKRVECFLKDMDDITKRIRRDCESAKARAKQDVISDKDEEQAGLQANRLHQPVRVVVEEEMLALNLTSSGGGTTRQLRGAIERVAYHDDYSFPSVRSVVPKTHLLAVAVLEAVRRGADLRGSGREPAEVAQRLTKGDPAEERPFVRLSEALTLFVELAAEKSMFEWIAKIAGQTTEKKRAFLAAIQLHEAQGAILLTKVDGGGGNKSRGIPFEEELVIHVNPAWFADLVRRVVDIRLLDPAQQGEVVGEIERCAPAASMRNLSRQHWRFIQAGEVSRDYLQFLWRRDMKLGPASRKAPPLDMSEKAITEMVGSLLDIRFMFQVRDSNGGILPDRYIVSSCLPDYVGCVETVDSDADAHHIRCGVDPREMLELKKGGAIYSIGLKLVGARTVPPGLVPRFLAWCGRGDGRIKACWKQGVCFAFKGEHLVLLFERRDEGQRSVIECHVRGSDDNEKAGGVLSDVVTELDRLLRDMKYGFPGIGLLETAPMKKRSACSDDDLEALLTRLESALEDHMNVKFEELARKSDNIAGCIKGYLHRAEKRMDDFEQTVNTTLGEMRQEIFSKLDFIAAVASKCLLVSVKGDNPCPRLISVEEDVTPTSTLSKFSHYRRKAMDPFRRTLGKTKAQQLKPKRYRVRFLCSYDMSAAECGRDGQGYIVESEKDWQRWLQKCLPLVQVSLWLLRVGVSVVARADVLPVDDVMGKLREVAGEEAAAYIEAIDVKSFEARNGGLSSKVVNQKEVFDGAYSDLAIFVQEEEKNVVVTSRELGARDTPTLGGGASSEHAAIGVPAASTAPISTVSPAGKRSFERDMVLEYRQRGNDPPQWAWVRRVNLGKWQRFEDPNPAAAAQATGALP